MVQMSEQPPPYLPLPPSAPGSSAFSGQPSVFPGSPYQTFPQTYTGGDSSYYQGPSGPMGPPGAYQTQPGYQVYQSGPPVTSHPGSPLPWDGPKTYGQPPKNSLFVVDQNRGGGGAEQSCLAACSAALCCCCLWDMLTHNFC